MDSSRGKRFSVGGARTPADAFNAWVQARKSQRSTPQRLALAAQRRAALIQRRHDRYLLRSAARRSTLLENTEEHHQGRPLQYFPKTGKHAYPLSKLRLTRHSPGEIVVPQDVDATEFAELTENLPRAPRDKPKGPPKPKHTRPVVTQLEKKERAARARAEYIKKKQDERRRDVIDFIMAVEVTGFDSDGVNTRLPYVEGWMFPIVIPIGRRNISFKTKRDFLERYVWAPEEDRPTSSHEVTYRVRDNAKQSKRQRMGKASNLEVSANLAPYGAGSQINGPKGSTTQDGWHVYTHQMWFAALFEASYDFTVNSQPAFTLRYNDVSDELIGLFQVVASDPVVTSMAPKAGIMASQSSVGTNTTLVAGDTIEAFFSYIVGGRTCSLCFPDYGITLSHVRSASSGAPVQFSAGCGQLAAAIAELLKSCEYVPSNATPAAMAFLNGNNGEWTNSDDVKKVGARKARVQIRVIKKGARKRTAARKPRATIPRGPALSHCALKYARAIAAPFSPDAFGSCVPVFPSPDSQKVHSLRRAFVFNVGTGGIGGIFIAPCASSQGYNVVGTTPTYAGTTLQLPATLDATVSAGAASTLPFGNADFGTGEAGVRARIVSTGVRIKYVGTQLNMGGSIAGFFDPNHTPVGNNIYDMGDVTNLPYASFESVDRRMNFAIQTAAVSAHDVQFQDRGYCYTPNATLDYSGFKSAAIGAVVVTGEPGNAFELEMITHVEYIGAPASSALTKTHTDARGFEMVQQASGQLASETANNRQSTWSVMTRLLGQAARDLAPHVVRAGVQVARSRLAGPRPMLTIQDF